MSWNHDISFMWTSGTPMFFLAIDRGAEEMSSGVHTRGVDIVVLGIVAHFRRVELYGSLRIEFDV